MNTLLRYSLILLLPLLSCKPALKELEYKRKYVVPEPISITFLRQNTSYLDAYLHQVDSVLQLQVPVLRMHGTPEQNKAQEIALNYTQILRNTFHFESGEALHSEIIQVEELGNYEYQVELYNFFYNSTSIARVNLKAEAVLDVQHQSAYHPQPNKHLLDLAQGLAMSYPEVKSFTASGKVKVLSRETRCERSRHYATAVVFVKGDEVLWSIVDFNTWQVVGIAYINKSELDAGVKITERDIQNAFVMEELCNTMKVYEHGDWSLEYLLTGSDGLELKNAYFKGKPVLKSAKLVDWHVNYPFGKKGYGFTDAMGCPMFSSAAIVAFNKPKIEPISDGDTEQGFSITQDFKSPVWPLSCNYYYQNVFEFYTDGSFAVLGKNLGLGCSEGATYRPVFRIDLFPGDNHFEKIEDAHEVSYKAEFYEKQKREVGSHYKLFQMPNTGFEMYELDQWSGYDSRIDWSYIYVHRYHQDREEGQGNLSTIGPHNSNDYHQGPEQFVQSEEPLEDQDLVLWYVPQMSNNAKAGKKYCWVDLEIDHGKAATRIWPGQAGLFFKPFNK